MRTIKIKPFKRTLDDVTCYNLEWNSFDERTKRKFGFQSLSLTRKELEELKDKCVALCATQED